MKVLAGWAVRHPEDTEEQRAVTRLAVREEHEVLRLGNVISCSLEQVVNERLVSAPQAQGHKEFGLGVDHCGLPAGRVFAADEPVALVGLERADNEVLGGLVVERASVWTTDERYGAPLCRDGAW